MNATHSLDALIAETLDATGTARRETVRERAERHMREALLAGDVRKLAAAALVLN